MKHFGAVSAPSPSHVMSFGAIGRKLQEQGHRCTLFGIPEIEDLALKEGLDFCPLGNAGEHALSNHVKEMGQQRGFSSTTVRSGMKHLTASAAFLCEKLRTPMRASQVDCMMVDQMEPAAASACEAEGIPFVTICNGLPINEEPNLPPWFLPWAYWKNPLGRARNSLAYKIRDLVIAPLHRVLNTYRRSWNLPAYRKPEDSLSPFAQVTQLVRELDLPRTRLPRCFHYTGPFREPLHREVPFPYERLNGQPIIYASLGTILDGSTGLWRTIAESCAGLPAQLVLSLGGRGRAENYADMMGDPLVVTYAPQRYLLKQAQLVISPAGLNTTLEALGEGIPLVALPTLNDQFGVAARVQYAGVGKVVPIAKCRTALLRTAVESVLYDRRFSKEASRIQKAILESGGVTEAARVVGQVAVTGKPVLAEATA